MRLFIGALLGLVVVAGNLLAVEVEATLKKIDAETGVVVFSVQEKDRTVQISKQVQVLDVEGNELAGGLKSPALKEGVVVVLTVERANDQPVLKAIRLSKKPAATITPEVPAKLDTSMLRALTDLGNAEYKGFKGGLYPDTKNERPTGHEQAGIALAHTIQPLDAHGKPSTDGRTALLGIGFSNTVQAFQGLMEAAKGDQEINPKLVLVNGAVGGMSANMIQHPDDNGRGAKYWATVDERLKTAGVTRTQVQVVWIKETNPAPHVGGFPKYIQVLQSELGNIVRILPKRFPNAKLAYLSSRTYGGWAKTLPGRAAPGNSEPFSYESGFAVKWLIEQQLHGDPALNYDPARGDVKAPWLSWGSYLWANGTSKRADGFSFEYDDFRENDRMHESFFGMRKVGNRLLQFFKTDPTTRVWFVRQ